MKTNTITKFKNINYWITMVITYITFVFINMEKLKTSKMNFFIEYWYYIIASIIIGFTYKWMVVTLKNKTEIRIKKAEEDIKVEFEKMQNKINAEFEKKKNDFITEKQTLIDTIFNRQVSLFATQATIEKLIKYVLLPNIENTNLTNIFENCIFNNGRFIIPELELFGIDSEIIAKLRCIYFEQEKIKQEKLFNETNNKEVK